MNGAADLSGKGGSLIEGNAPDFLAFPKITVLGVGNVLLSDEGFGVRAAEALDATYDFPDDVQVLDGGVLGMELLRFVTGTEKLLILDALKEGGADGRCRRLAGDEVRAHFREKLSAHEIGLQDVLTFLEVTGKPIGEVVVIGAEPKSLEAGLSLSREMAPLVAEAAKMAAEELSRWDIKLKRKDDIK